MSTSPAVTITGTMQDILGAASAGTVTFTLVNYGSALPKVAGSNLIAQIQQSVTANGSGVFSITVFGNYQITPANTYYTVSVCPANSTAPVSLTAYQFNTGGTFDLSTISPFNAVTVSTPPPASVRDLNVGNNLSVGTQLSVGGANGPALIDALGNGTFTTVTTGTLSASSQVSVNSGAALISSTGKATVADLVTKGPWVDLRAFGADPTGINDSSTAFTNAIAAAGTGAELLVPPGTYIVNNVVISNPIRIRGLGKCGWPTSGVTPTIIATNATGGNSFIIQAATNPSTTLLMSGPEIANICFMDKTNTGAGGLAAGGILVNNGMRCNFRGLSFGNFSGAGAYGLKIFQTQNTAYDSSYHNIEQPFVRNCDTGIVVNSGASAVVVLGGEIVANSIGIDLSQFTLNTTCAWVLGTSVEVPVNAIGIKIATQQAVIDCRFEGSTGATGNRLVQLTGTAQRNIIRGTFNKGDVQVECLAGSTSNYIDVTSNVSAALAVVNDLGVGNKIIRGGKADYNNYSLGGLLSTVGFRSSLSPANITSMVSMMLGRYGMVCRSTPGSNQWVGSGAMVRDGAGTLTVTTPSNHSFAVGMNVIIAECPDNTFNTAAAGVPIASVADSTHFTIAQVGTATTSGYAWVYSTAGLGLGADGISATIGHGLDQILNNSSMIASHTSASFQTFTAGNVNWYGNSGLTIGSAFTRQLLMQLAPNGSLALNNTAGSAVTLNLQDGGTNKWQIQKDSSNVFRVFDTADSTRPRLSFTTAALTNLNSGGSSAVQINSNTNSGTGGLQVWNGGATPAQVAYVDGTGLGSFVGLNTSGALRITGTSNVPTSGGTTVCIVGGTASPVAGKVYIGDGGGWQLNFSKRSASTDTELFQFKDSGDLIATGKGTFSGGLVSTKIVLEGKQAPAITTNTLTIDASTGGIFRISLNANITTMSVTNPTDGQVINIIWVQDATGSRTVAFPANVKGATAPSATANSRSAQSFTYDSTTTNWYALGAGSTAM